MYLQPVLPDGRFVTLPWQLRLACFKVIWPPQENPTRWMKVADLCNILITVGSFLYVLEGALCSAIQNFDNIKQCTQSLGTAFVYNEIILRTISMALKKQSFAIVLKKFYLEVYVDEMEDLSVYRKINKSLTALEVYSYIYPVAFVALCLGPVIAAILYDGRLLPERVKLHYDIEDPLPYAITIAFLAINGMFALSVLIGEMCLLGNFVNHLCARYKMLQDKLERLDILLTRESNSVSEKTMRKFRTTVRNMIKETQKLNEFANCLKETYSFRVFTMISHSSVVLCILTFQASTVRLSSSELMGYVGWVAGKLLELIIFGELGSSLIETTGRVSSMFYQCNWEAIVYRSTSQRQNVLLMKEIGLATFLFSKPFELSGLGFFVVSLETITSIISAAGSYFTCLTAFQ